MKQLAMMIVMMLGLFYFQGCSTRPIGAKPDVVNAYPRVVFSSESLANDVRLTPATVSKSPTGMLTVTQPVRAAANDELFIEYRFIWKDASGQPVGPEMSWRYKRLEPRVNDTISANATSDAVTDYQIQMRWALK